MGEILFLLHFSDSEVISGHAAAVVCVHVSDAEMRAISFSLNVTLNIYVAVHNLIRQLGIHFRHPTGV
jgi:hypothetical protein